MPYLLKSSEAANQFPACVQVSMKWILFLVCQIPEVETCHSKSHVILLTLFTCLTRRVAPDYYFYCDVPIYLPIIDDFQFNCVLECGCKRNIAFLSRTSWNVCHRLSSTVCIPLTRTPSWRIWPSASLSICARSNYFIVSFMFSLEHFDFFVVSLISAESVVLWLKIAISFC
jgi:hypothetical protein